MLVLERFIHENKDWAKLLIEPPYNLNITYDTDYVLFKYNMIESDFTNPIVQEARGIIFNIHTLKPVCIPFFKFFNYGEPNAAQLDWSTSFVTEKIDGSLIKVWFDHTWHISTNGTIDAYKAPLDDIKAPNFGLLFEKAITKYYPSADQFFGNLDQHYTYLFELISPQNRIVIPYDAVDMYFLGARNNTSLEMLPCKSIFAASLGVGRIKIPKTFKLASLTDCIKAAEEMSWDTEGFVVADAKGARIKIKSPSYVLAHYMRNNNVITKRHLINVILLNEIDEFICYAADYADKLYEIKAVMDFYKELGNLFISICKQYRTLPRAKYAEIVKAFPKVYTDMLFVAYDREITAEDYTSRWTKNKWYENFEIIQSFKATYFK